jgi:hypothetical protein
MECSILCYRQGVATLSNSVTHLTIMAAQVIVATNLGLADSVKIDESCRQQGTAFIRAELHGVFGSVFCDFGKAFTVLDVDGMVPVLTTGILLLSLFLQLTVEALCQLRVGCLCRSQLDSISSVQQC